jgi:Cysteine-rich secretory protein family
MRILILAALTALTVQQEQDLDAKVVERVNFHRKAAGLDAVVLDPALAKGCALHAQYILKNADNPAVQGAGMHREDPKLPGYTDEGAKAAKTAVIVATSDPVVAVDNWMASLFHRLPLLDQRLTKIGVGYAPGGKSGGWIVLHTPPVLPGKQTKPVLFPPDKQAEVQLRCCKENPSPVPPDKIASAGYPITVMFPADASVTGVKATLQDSDNQNVEVWLSTPEEPAAGQKRFQRNSIALIPMANLKPDATYTVSVTAMVNKKEWKQSWSFTTGKK